MGGRGGGGWAGGTSKGRRMTTVYFRGKFNWTKTVFIIQQVCSSEPFRQKGRNTDCGRGSVSANQTAKTWCATSANR